MIKELFGYASNKLEFEANRYRMAIKEQTRRYEAASYGRRTVNWDRQNRGPVADHELGLREIRGLSRDLIRNNPYAKRAVEVIVGNVVGSGIIPVFSGTGSDKVKAAWTKYGNTSKCDFDERANFYGIEEQIIRAVVTSGDAIVLKKVIPGAFKKGYAIPYEYQVLESDFLDETKTVSQTETGGFIAQGVEFDKRGKKVAYWLFDEHPGEGRLRGSYASRPVAASEVIHVFETLRPGQVRGIPFGVSAFVKLKDFDEFQDFELYKQKVAACLVMVVTDEMGEGSPTYQQERNDYVPLDKMGPGIIEHLPPGKKVEFSNPPSVTGSDQYVSTQLRAVAMGYGTSYEALSGDYSKVNFSSGRMARIDFYKNIGRWQENLMIVQFCHKAMDWFLWGYGLATRFNATSKIVATWTSPKVEMIDPETEAKAIQILLRNGITSKQEEQRKLGYDPDDVTAEQILDRAVSEKNGFKWMSDPKYDAQREMIEVQKIVAENNKKASATVNNNK